MQDADELKKGYQGIAAGAARIMQLAEGGHRWILHREVHSLPVPKLREPEWKFLENHLRELQDEAEALLGACREIRDWRD